MHTHSRYVWKSVPTQLAPARNLGRLVELPCWQLALVLVVWLSHAVAFAQEPTSPSAELSELSAARALEFAMVGCIEKAERSVVAIARGRRGAVRDLSDSEFVPHEYGTGVVVDANGLILTNYHLLGEVDQSDYVVWIAGKVYSAVRVKAADPWTDLAILETKARGATPIEFGDAEGLKKGRIAIALGNPHAIARDGNVSATWGIIANLDRKIDGPLQRPNEPDSVALRDRETRYHHGALIQTDAKLARGTSGGPLLDLDGRMIGLMTSVAVLAGFEKGTGYAIPVDETFRRIVEKLKRGEEIEQGFLGVAPRNAEGDGGVVLERVEAGTPAGQSGLRAFDEIVRIDDAAIRSTDDLYLRVGSLPPDHVAQITVRRNFEEFTLPVRLTKKALHASRPLIATAKVPTWRGLQVDYSTALSARRVPALDPKGCVIVKQVDHESLAWKAGLRVGVMISHVGARRVTRPQEFFAAVSEQTEPVQLTTYDGNRSSTVTVD